MPDHPAAWLVQTGRNRALDRLRRDRAFAARMPLLATPQAADDPLPETEMTIPDERLELLFTCCHPALSLEAQVALTLRTLGGLSSEEIARAFLVAPEAMKRRLSRARVKVRLAGIPFAVPSGERLTERLAAVRAVIYLIFNEGYSSPPPGRAPLAREAIRLALIVCDLLPADAEARGLLALMLLHDARRDARFEGGELVLLADQDRGRWDQREIARGRAELGRALAAGARGPFQVQAAIAALQLEAPIDWPQVAALYAELADLTGSPVVQCNRAVAIAEADGPAAGLAHLDAHAAALTEYQYLHSTRAEMLVRLGRGAEARDAYGRAIALARPGPERAFLERRRAAVPARYGSSRERGDTAAGDPGG